MTVRNKILQRGDTQQAIPCKNSAVDSNWAKAKISFKQEMYPIYKL